MKHELIEFLKKENIELYGITDATRCRVKLAHVLRRAGFASCEGEEGKTPRSLLCLCFPYFSEFPKNLSAYAAARDYHAFCDGFFRRFTALLASAYPQYTFCGFADKSPYDEVYAASLAGLGKRGDNMLFLTEKYSSFVFLGEIVSDMPCEEWELPKRSIEDPCIHCGKCKDACPGYKAEEFFCLSALTQKKGELTPEEEGIIRRYKSAWGCDICQKVCPVTQNALKNGTIYTPIEYFKSNITHELTTELIENMSDEEFTARAYSWRGKNTVLRNLKILNEE
ncbi:MAG: epoxyqueuosine reductase [Clostridia bacterium]|nr:epoxyqueuosine reductase [Clostridia bacterium]